MNDHQEDEMAPYDLLREYPLPWRMERSKAVGMAVLVDIVASNYRVLAAKLPVKTATELIKFAEFVDRDWDAYMEGQY